MIRRGMAIQSEKRSRVFRLILAAPPALLLLAGLVMLIMTPFAWGAAAYVGQPDWTTSFNGLLFAVPAIAVGAITLRETLKRTADEFTLAPIQIGVGFVFILAVAAGVLIFALRITDPATYETLRPTSSRDRGVSPSAFLMIGIFGTAVTAMVTAWVAFLYAQSIFGEAPSRFDKQPGEEDAVGTLLEERESRADLDRTYEHSGFLAEVGYACQQYWAWMTGGSKRRLLGGILVLLFIPMAYLGAVVLPSVATSPPPNTNIEFVSGALGSGTIASIRAKTSPGFVCSLAITLPSGEKSAAPGLTDKTADESGHASWSWTVDQVLGREGKVKFDVTCNSNEHASFSVDLSR